MSKRLRLQSRLEREAQERQWQREDMLRAQEQERLAQERARAEAEAARRRQEDLLAAIGLGRADAMNTIAQRGLNPDDYAPRVQSEIDRLVASIGSADPRSFISGRNIAEDLLRRDEASRRAAIQRDLDRTIGANYGDRLIDDNFLNRVIDDIVASQRSRAQDYLDRGRARGIYTDAGYQRGLGKINEMSSRALASLASNRNDLVRRYESMANQVRDDAYNAANNFRLGSDFNLDDFIQRGDRIRQQYETFGEGEFRNLIGGTNFFDLPAIHNEVGFGQGAQNPRDLNLLEAVEQRRRRRGPTSFGLGNQGAF